MSTSAHATDPRLSALAGGLVVSCQAPVGSPLRSPAIMLAMAQAAEAGGATGIRANGPDDVSLMVDTLDIPVLGLSKVAYPDSPVFITPTLAEVEALLATGCRMIALDTTNRPRPRGASLPDLVRHIHDAGALAFGDMATEDDLEPTLAAGIDAVGTTLSGYTTDQPVPEAPDLALVRHFADRATVPVFAEGRYATPEDVLEARLNGADFVVVGTAITEPIALTRRFVSAFRPGQDDS